MGFAGPWLCRPPGYMGTGAPGWELGGMGPEGKEVDGMKLVGGTPGVDDGGGSAGPDKLAADTEGPGGEKTERPPMDIG